MTDHLATAQRWLSTAQDSRSFDHLMSAMDQILDHLDAMQAEESLRRGLADIAADRVVDLGTFAPSAQEVTSAPQTAPQAEAGQGDGGEAVRAAAREIWRWYVGPSTDAFDQDKHAYAYDIEKAVGAAQDALAAAEPHIRAKTLAPIRAALANHPRCDIHPDDDPIKCGWKRAVASVQAALDKEDR